MLCSYFYRLQVPVDNERSFRNHVTGKADIYQRVTWGEVKWLERNCFVSVTFVNVTVTRGASVIS